VSLNPAVTDRLLAAGLDPDDTERLVREALAEDFRYGPDVTTSATVAAFRPDAEVTAEVAARQSGVLAGVPVALAVLDIAGIPIDAATPLATDGDRVSAGQAVIRVSGRPADLLSAERSVLNFLTHLSGIATATRAWTEAVAGTGAVIRDTRKTLPGLRLLQKYAVRCGGGANLRFGLGDAVLIKDNHIAAAGGVAAAIRAVREVGSDLPMEVECDTLEQVAEALAAGAGLILLDNMNPAEMREAVVLARGYPGVGLEASGGLRLENARAVAETGVDFLSVGALTHSSPALDLGMDLL